MEPHHGNRHRGRSVCPHSWPTLFLLVCLVVTQVIIVRICDAAAAQQLTGGFRINRDQITLAGLSTGGTFAETFHLAYSSYFSGIGIFSAFFWKCGNYSSSLEQMYATCGKPGGYDTQGKQPIPGAEDPALAIKTAKMYASQGKIDKLDNLAGQKIFMWQGTLDEYITPNNGLSALNIYEPYLYSPDQIFTKIQYSHHHFPTVRSGVPCPDMSDPYKDAFIGACQYFGAYHMLNFLLSRGPSFQLIRPKRYQLTNKLIKFDQTEFMKDAHGNTMDIGLANEGFLYVPTNCKTSHSACYLHFYFHGCFLTKDEVGTEHIENTGLLRVAERNNIIIVFPMALVTPFNTGGCFDSFGYTGENYGTISATKSGPQVTAVLKIMKRVLSKKYFYGLSSSEEESGNTHAMN